MNFMKALKKCVIHLYNEHIPTKDDFVHNLLIDKPPQQYTDDDTLIEDEETAFNQTSRAPGTPLVLTSLIIKSF